MDCKGTWIVVGLARSGIAAGALLRRHGGRVIGVDDAPRDKVDTRLKSQGLDGRIDEAFDEVRTGPGWDADLPRLAGAVLSPGVPTDHPAVNALGVPVIGELELGWRAFAGDAVAVTGTNGKTTTTELTAHLLRVAGRDARALGNVGRPLCDVADTLAADAVAVIECSSFQLETVDAFAPRSGAVLNLAPDHLDRYPDLDAYYAAKRRLTACLGDDGLFVTWTGCPEALSWPAARRTLFGARRDGASVFVHDGHIVRLRDGSEEEVLPVADLGLTGGPNLLNALAATALVEPFGLSATDIATGLRSFTGLAHRQELVAEAGGVRWVNDSKATNVHAVCAGLDGYERDVVLILGGSGKGEDYAPLREALGPVTRVVLIGDEAQAMAVALEGAAPLERAATMEEAVAAAARAAAGRGTVLLSPACASFDMFRSYEHRGEAFRDAVLAGPAREPGS